MEIKLLKWDSNFFNIKIGKMVFKDLKNISISQIYSIAKKEGFKLLYIESNTQFRNVGSHHGTFRFVDIKTLMQTDVSRILPFKANWTIVEYNKPYVIHELEQLAYESGLYSRFHTDPMFPDSLFKKLYKKWIHDSLTHRLADIVLVCLNNRLKPIGFITIKKSRAESHIGLISVAKKYRKKKIGLNLLQSAMHWSFMNRCKYLTITTQFNNFTAMKLYYKNMFKINEKKYYYHYWITT